MMTRWPRGYRSFLARARTSGPDALVALVITGSLPTGTRFVPFGDTNWSAQRSVQDDIPGYAMIDRSAGLDLSDLTAQDAGGIIDVWLGFGEVRLDLPTLLPVQVETNGLIGNIDYPSGTRNDQGFFIHDVQGFNAATDTPVTTVRVWSLIGSVDVSINN